MQKTGPVTGINFIGMLEHQGGIGNAARMNCKELKKLGYKVHELPFPASGRHDPRLLGEPPHSMNMLHFNPEATSLPTLMGCKWFGYRNIQYAAWETSRAPDSWAAWSQWIDALWVPSQFTSDAVKAAGWKGRVFVIPHFVQRVHRRDIEPQPDMQAARFFISWDGKSRVERKLPHLSIAAAVIGSHLAGVAVELVIKCHDYSQKEFRDTMSKARTIVSRYIKNQRSPVLEMYRSWMSATRVMELMKGCHAVISLNRGEGFGLGGLEALSHGVPIIWTNWGGSQQYLEGGACYPVNPVAVVPVKNDGYFKTGSWAEPSLDHAITQVKSCIDAWRDGSVSGIIDAGYGVAEKFTAAKINEQMKLALEAMA